MPRDAAAVGAAPVPKVYSLAALAVIVALQLVTALVAGRHVKSAAAWTKA